VPTDATGNVAIHEPIILDNCAGTLVHTSHDKLTVAPGLENFFVLIYGNVLLIFPKLQAQQNKRLRALVQEKGFDRFL
jgi:hypothetical protein